MINFGVNIYALDIDMHTAQELAAINNADNVLRYLDAVVAKVVCTKDWTHVNVIIILPFTFNIYILIALLIFLVDGDGRSQKGRKTQREGK